MVFQDSVKRLFFIFMICCIITLHLTTGILLAANSKSSQSALSTKDARYYIELPYKKVQCLLCPRECILSPGDTSFCRVRRNMDGKLYTLVYGKPVTVHLDPIEKKPIFHLLPGSQSFSIATVGCNLGCMFCQNWQISQAKPEEVKNFNLLPQEVVEKAINSNSKSISYTYTEPTVFYEYMLDTASLAREKGLKNIYVTAEYINPEPLRELCKFIDAANCDLKGFTEEFYRKYTFGKLKSVLEAIRIMKEEGIWIEITNLVIPTVNDDLGNIREMCCWIKENLGTDVPLHFSRFSPAYKLTNLPPTPVETLESAWRVAKDVGLNYVYIGNVPGHPAENTYCPNCGKLLIGRIGYEITANNIDAEGGKCMFCSHKIPGIWK